MSTAFCFTPHQSLTPVVNNLDLALYFLHPESLLVTSPSARKQSDANGTSVETDESKIGIALSSQGTAVDEEAKPETDETEDDNEEDEEEDEEAGICEVDLMAIRKLSRRVNVLPVRPSFSGPTQFPHISDQPSSVS